MQRPEGSKGASRAAVSAHAKALGRELGVPWWGLEVSVVEKPQLVEGGGLGGQGGREGPDGLGPCGEKRAVREQTSENPAALKA